MLCGCTKTDGAKPGNPILETAFWTSNTILSARFETSESSIVAASADGTIRRWSAKTGAPLGEPIKATLYAIQAEVSPRGDAVFINDEGAITLWRPAALPQIKVISDDGTAASFSADSTWVLTGGQNGVAKIWDSMSGALIMELTGHEDDIWWLHVGTDKKKLIAGGDNPAGSIWDLSSKSRTALVGHTKWIMGGALSPDNSKVLTVSWDETAKLWNADTGQIVVTLSGHTSYLWVGEFSPDGGKVVTGGEDGVARIWDTDSGELLATATGHESVITSIIFDPKGAFFITGGFDGTARVWDIDTGRQIEKMSIHFGRVDSMAIDASGGHLLTASDDSTAAVWRLPLLDGTRE